MQHIKTRTIDNDLCHITIVRYSISKTISSLIITILISYPCIHPHGVYKMVDMIRCIQNIVHEMLYIRQAVHETKKEKALTWLCQCQIHLGRCVTQHVISSIWIGTSLLSPCPHHLTVCDGADVHPGSEGCQQGDDGEPRWRLPALRREGKWARDQSLPL